MSQFGRISGPLLADNLLRNGNDLSFETSLLYLNVVGNRIGINTIGPVTDLTIGGVTRTTNLIVDNDTTIANLEFSGYQIQNALTSITISPNQSSNPTVVAPIIETDNLRFTSNQISNTVLDDDIVITSIGGITINSDARINGDLHATGSITFDGNLQLGSDAADTIDFVADVNSNILPSTDNAYTLGNAILAWDNAYVHSLTINQQINLNTSGLDNLYAGNFTITGNNITLPVNNTATLIPTGSGVVNFNTNNLTLKIAGNTWTPDPSVDVFQFNSTGEGHYDLSASNVAFPVGATDQRPASAQVGMIRYNTSVGYEEVYNGVSWQPAIGAGGAISQEEVDDIMHLWSLILG